jgi:hypothetical protein
MSAAEAQNMIEHTDQVALGLFDARTTDLIQASPLPRHSRNGLWISQRTLSVAKGELAFTV